MMPSNPQDESYRVTQGSPGGLEEPYRKEAGLDGDMLPMGQQASVAQQAEMALARLPPEMRDMVMATLGSDPMLASALLAVLGPQFAGLIKQALVEQGQLLTGDMDPAALDPEGVQAVQPAGMMMEG